MYVPPHFREHDHDILKAFVAENPFAVLVSTTATGVPVATHLPLLWLHETNTLVGHIAKANPQAELLNLGTALAIFSGPHGYISSHWYSHAPAVPTWNYTAVHLSGSTRLISDSAEFAQIVLDLEAQFEREPQNYDLTFFEAKLKGIVGFELTIEKIDAAFKLSQNIPEESRNQVIETLFATNNTALAEKMKTKS